MDPDGKKSAVFKQMVSMTVEKRTFGPSCFYMQHTKDATYGCGGFGVDTFDGAAV